MTPEIPIAEIDLDNSAQKLYECIRKQGPLVALVNNFVFSDNPHRSMVLVIKAPRRKTPDGLARLVFYPRQSSSVTESWIKNVGTVKEPPFFRRRPRDSDFAINFGASMACSFTGYTAIRIPHPKIELIRQSGAGNWKYGKCVGIEGNEAQNIVGSALSTYPTTTLES